MADARAVNFNGVTKVLGAPPNWDAATHGPCEGLPVMVRDGVCISCWRIPFWGRVRLLFGGRVYLHVASGQTQPPVALTVE